MDTELLLGRGSFRTSFRTSFAHHVFVLPLEETELWGRDRGVKAPEARALGEGHADQEGTQRDREAQSGEYKRDLGKVGPGERWHQHGGRKDKKREKEKISGGAGHSVPRAL